MPQTGADRATALRTAPCFILSQSQVRCRRNARVPLKARQAEGNKALRVTERQRPTEEMRDTPLLPRFSHHLPRSPRTPPRAQRRTEAERRPTTRSQSQAASEECSSPLCRGSVDREDDEAKVRRPQPAAPFMRMLSPPPQRCGIPANPPHREHAKQRPPEVSSSATNGRDSFLAPQPRKRSGLR